MSQKLFLYIKIQEKEILCMEQLKLGNGSTYDLVTGGIVDIGNERLQITILAGLNTFSGIESDFDNEVNTQKIKVVDSLGENLIAKNGYTYLESITKQNGYVTGTEEYTDDNGETNYRDVMETVYVIYLAKPDLRAQVKNLQETVDVLVLEGLGE